MANYPECEKLAKVSDESQEIGTFLEWLRNVKEYEFAKWNTDDLGIDRVNYL